MMAYKPLVLANDFASSLPAAPGRVEKTAGFRHREVAQPGRAPRSGQPNLPKKPQKSASRRIAQSGTERAQVRNKVWRACQLLATMLIPYRGTANE
jgi:hypothetical protein